jgi:hypothetical protein
MRARQKGTSGRGVRELARLGVTVYKLDGIEARTREYYNDAILR